MFGSCTLRERCKGKLEPAGIMHIHHCYLHNYVYTSVQDKTVASPGSYADSVGLDLWNLVGLEEIKVAVL